MKKKLKARPAGKRQRKKTAAKRPKKKVAKRQKPRTKANEKTPTGKIRKKSGSTARVSTETPGRFVGTVTHYFPKAGAAALTIEKQPLKVNDKILIQGAGRPLKQKVVSLQINRIPVEVGRNGDEVGIQTTKEVREGDKVYKL